MRRIENSRVGFCIGELHGRTFSGSLAMHELGNGEPKCEARALSRYTGHRDVAAHLLRETATDRQAEPGAAVRARVAVVDLNERIEHARQIVARNADSGVFDFDTRPA